VVEPPAFYGEEAPRRLTDLPPQPGCIDDMADILRGF